MRNELCLQIYGWLQNCMQQPPAWQGLHPSRGKVPPFTFRQCPLQQHVQAKCLRAAYQDKPSPQYPAWCPRALQHLDRESFKVYSQPRSPQEWCWLIWMLPRMFRSQSPYCPNSPLSAEFRRIENEIFWLWYSSWARPCSLAVTLAAASKSGPSFKSLDFPNSNCGRKLHGSRWLAIRQILV